jgi:hypothetical protein
MWLLAGVFIGFALPLLAWLPAAFLNGGLLLAYAEAPQPLRWRRFCWGGWHWFGTFLVLGLVQGIAFTVALLAGLAAVGAAVAAVGQWLIWLALPLLGLAASLWLAWMEGARIVAVVGGTRNVLRAMGGGIRFVFRHLPSFAVLYGLTLLLTASLHLVFRWGLMRRLPLDWWPLVLLVQQSFVLARLGTRLLRLAGGAALARESAGTKGAGLESNPVV